MRSALIGSLLIAAMSAPCEAIVGGAPVADDAAARSVVAIVGARGNFCSAALIAPDIVLTAAHCVAGGAAAEFRVVTYSAAQQPALHEVQRVATHPDFKMQAIAVHRASADVAMLQLAQPIVSRPVAVVSSSPTPLQPGIAFRVVGIGVAVRGDGRSGGVTRAASLVATGKPGTLQLRLVDPSTNNLREGLGACTGDSGAPIFQQQGHSVVIAIVSWSTGANNAAGCGGLTGTTPLTNYRGWIELTTRKWAGAY